MAAERGVACSRVINSDPGAETRARTSLCSCRRQDCGSDGRATDFAHVVLVCHRPGIDAYHQGKFEDAYSQFQQTLKSHPESRAEDKLQFDSGAAAYKLKDYNKALESFSQALLTSDTGLQSRAITISATRFISAAKRKKVTKRSSATGRTRSTIMNRRSNSIRKTGRPKTITITSRRRSRS